jgi:SNF2 family DNA or RNA helicase
VPEFIPHVYQKRAIEDVVRDPAHCLWLDIGLGKTAAMLQAFCELQETLEVQSALLIGPLRVIYTVWEAEAQKWSQFRHLRLRNLHEKMDLSKPADIYMINPAGLPRLFGKPIDLESGKKVWEPGPWSSWHRRPEMLILDELTLWKNSQSGRSKTLRRYTADFSRRVGLTGTPAPNGLKDLFGEMLVIDRGEALGDKITHFREKWCQSVSARGKGRQYTKYPPRDGAFDEIQKLIKPRVTVLEGSDWIKLPDRIAVNVPVRLERKTLDLYRKAVKEAFALLDGDKPFDATAKAVKLKQLANGLVYTGDPLSLTREVVRVHDKKVEALDELLDELQRPALVAYEYKCDGEALVKKLRRKFELDFDPIINGKTKSSQTLWLIDQWNKEKLPVLLLQPQAVSHGLNLQFGGNAIIWYSQTFDLELYQQLNGRLHRQGQKSPSVFFYHLVAQGTIDERVVGVLEDKAATQDALIAALKEEIFS